MPARKPAAPRPRSPRSTPREPLPPVRCRPVTVEELPAFFDVLAGSYPLFMESRERILPGLQEVLHHGYPEMIAGFDPRGRVVGTYSFYTFVATIAGRGLPAGGLGMVATALDRKKQHVALELVRDFVRRTREHRMPISLLYPFRHDFYAAMGWGAVAEVKQYRVAPAALPLYPERREVRWIRHPDWSLLDRIHRQAVGRQGGLGLSRHVVRWHMAIHQAQQIFVAGPEEAPEGYLLARFAKHEGDADKTRHDLEVVEMDWMSPTAMRALLGFLSSQRDQVIEVIFDWPREGNLDAVFSEPVRRGAAALPGHLGTGAAIGHGAMLRLEDPEEAFRVRPCRGFNAVALDVRTRDPLEKHRALHFRTELRGEKAAEGTRPRPVRLSADLKTLAQLWAGALRFGEAVDLGAARLSPEEAAKELDELFAVPLPWIAERF